jgi:predicted nucleic acid-binding protein
MNIVDSSGWLEFFADGPNAEQFAVPLQDLANLVVPAITLYEVFKVVCRQRGEDAALQAVALMQQGEVVELNASLALHAAKISLELKLPMADSIILATAHSHQAILWTQDIDFADLQGVRYFTKV